MGIADACTGLHHQRDGFVDGVSSALAQDGLEVLAGDVFHNDVKLIVIKAEIMDGDNVGVREVSRGARFCFEAFLKVIVVRIFFMQDLDRNRTFEHQVACKKHIRHAACADAFE